VEIRDIYRGYLDLILRLESIYIGGVEPWHILEDPTHVRKLLRVYPTTPVSARTFITPACEKFNTLNSTQLDTVMVDDEVAIYTKAIAPVVYSMHRHMQRYVEFQQNSITRTGYDKLRLSTGLEYLKAMLENQINGLYGLADLCRYYEFLHDYDHYQRGGKEGDELFYLIEQETAKIEEAT